MLLYLRCIVISLLDTNRSSSSWKTKSFLSASVSEPYTDVDRPIVEQSQGNKRSLECSDSEIDDNDDYASFRGKKQSKKKVRIEANRARNVSPSGSEVIFDTCL